jgi:hypothetical protein
MEIGPTPIRMQVKHHEVVWCERIDPARAFVRSIPLPESGRRYGDLLLHDGAPAGTRMLEGRELSVFDELALLAPSDLNTYVVKVVASVPAAMDDLLGAFLAASIPAEDWTGSVRMLATRSAVSGAVVQRAPICSGTRMSSAVRPPTHRVVAAPAIM